MVRLLEDLCLRCIARNMAKLPASNLQWLTVTQKEVLLERMASHQLLTSAVLPLATVHLLASHLRTVVLDRCSQVSRCLANHTLAPGPMEATVDLWGQHAPQMPLSAWASLRLHFFVTPYSTVVDMEIRSHV